MNTSASLSPDDERIKAFIDDSDIGMYEADLQGNLTFCNQTLGQIFGFSPELLLGHPFTRLLEGGQKEKALELFQTVAQTGKGYRDLLWTIQDGRGRKRKIGLSINLILDREGRGIGFRGIVSDRTDSLRIQAEIQESEARYRTLLDFIPYPMVVFTIDSRVMYLNPAFTRIFGWTLDELQGKQIPYIPPGREEETQKIIQRLFQEKFIPKVTTQRLTKDGRVLDVNMSGSVYPESGNLPGGVLVIIRDITQQKKITDTNTVIFRISIALPSHPDLEDLLDYVSEEIKQLLNAEGAVVLLLDEEKKEFYFQGAAYDDQGAQERAKEVRFSSDRGIAGEVLRTGKSIIVPDTAQEPRFYSIVDRRMNFRSRNILDVPLRSRDRIIGVLCAINKKTGMFDSTDEELLNLIAGTVALSIENARITDELKNAYSELADLNRAKDRAINRLSHEMRTPLSILLASLNILNDQLNDLPHKKWEKTLKRSERNLRRLLDIQYEVQDIMQDRAPHPQRLLNKVLDQVADELEVLLAQETGEGPLVEKVRQKIEEIYRPPGSPLTAIRLDQFILARIEGNRSAFGHRNLALTTHFSPVPQIWLPEEVFQKVFDGLLRNAIEATPDGGAIKVVVEPKGEGVNLRIEDRGVGITAENQKRIFEGFFSTQETGQYSSKNPYDFGAGGKGADLLRIKIFSERYQFKLEMTSSRCLYIPRDRDQCPGDITRCSFCTTVSDCLQSGGSTVSLYFPPSASQGSTQAETGGSGSK
jgi:PAS domain S-box-containing protein